MNREDREGGRHKGASGPGAGGGGKRLEGQREDHGENRKEGSIKAISQDGPSQREKFCGLVTSMER